MVSVAMFLVFFCFFCVLAQEGNILLRKTLDSELTGLYAPGRNFTVQIEIFNAGDSSAYDVRVTDAWPTDKFTLVGGNTNETFQEIPAGTKKSYNFTLQPNFDGEYNGFAARVEYQPTLDAPHQIGWSTLTRGLTLIDNTLFNKLTAKHEIEWTVFFLLSFGSVLVPFGYWLQLITNYEHGIPRLSAEKRSKRKLT